MGDFLYEDVKGPNLDYPDSAIRLACVVHRFKVPKPGKGEQVCLADSFRTVGTADKTRKLMLTGDDARKRLVDGLKAKKISSERVVADARRYIPMIYAVLISCKIQPEGARLDHKLLFEWKSGVEHEPEAYKSEAIMYDLTMSIVCEGLGRALAATEHSMAGEFAAANRDYAAAAGIFDYLANIHLPKWIAKGSKVDSSTLPTECHAAASKALKILFMANGQQMAVATMLMKEGKPNYSLLAKLCLGIHEQLEEFVATLRREAFDQMSRMDKEFFTLITFQINVQKSLSLYFQARSLWDKIDYGIAIALLSEATVALRTRESAASHGIPDITKSAALSPLTKDLTDLRNHMQLVLKTWEKDNNSVYFESVPQHVPAEKKLQEGVQMKRMEAYKLDDPEPVLLILPEGNEGRIERSDSDLARELQARLNAGENV